jgi:hypothetical protein
MDARWRESALSEYLRANAQKIVEHTLTCLSSTVSPPQVILEPVRGPLSGDGYRGVGLQYGCGRVWRDDEFRDSITAQRAIDNFERESRERESEAVPRLTFELMMGRPPPRYAHVQSFRRERFADFDQESK